MRARPFTNIEVVELGNDVILALALENFEGIFVRADVVRGRAVKARTIALFRRVRANGQAA